MPSRRLVPALVAAALATAALVTPTPTRATTAPDPEVRCRGDVAGAVVSPDDLGSFTGEPVLLVHGTFTNGDENYRWALAESLATDGFGVCWFDYPNRGLDDMQTSGEMTAAAIVEVATATGSEVDVLGHSQGGILPRWALRWFPDARAVVDDLVMLAAPSHGTDLNSRGCNEWCPGAFWQFDPASDFVEAMNRDQETFEGIDFTAIYTDFDQLVRPPESAALVDVDPSTPNVVNIRIQDVCVGRPVEHAGLFVDHVMRVLAVDAFTTPGPADPAAVAPTDCAQPVFTGADPAVGVEVGLDSFLGRKGFSYQPVPAEPPLREYARP